MKARSFDRVVRATLQPLALSTDEVRRGDADVGEEHLVEVGDAGDLPHRADVDARRTHVDDEVRDATVLRLIGIGTGEEDGEIGELAERGPHLLPVDDVSVAVALGPSGERGEVGAGSRFAEQLAPQLDAAEHRVEVPLLIRRAVRHERGCHHADRHRERADGDIEAGLLLGEDRRLDCSRAASAELLRPGDPRPPVLVECRLPSAARSNVIAEIDLVVGRRRRWSKAGVIGQPGPGGGAKGRFVGRVSDVHPDAPPP